MVDSLTEFVDFSDGRFLGFLSGLLHPLQAVGEMSGFSASHDLRVDRLLKDMKTERKNR